MKQISFNPQLFFQLLQEDLGERVKLAQWLMELLEISSTSAYERISGKRELSNAQLLAILHASPRTFQRAVETMVNLPMRLFELNQFQNAEEAHQYLLRIEKFFIEASRHADFQLRYVALDLPVFYFFADPTLFTYKISTWSGQARKAGWCTPVPETLAGAQRLWEMYQAMPTVELWYPLAWKKQLDMVRHDQRHGFLSTEQANHLKQVYERLLAQFKTAAATGRKARGGSLEAYSTLHFSLNNCGVVHYNNCVTMLGTVHNAQHFDSSCQNSMALFNKLWDRHMETADPLIGKNNKWLNQCFEGDLNEVLA